VRKFFDFLLEKIGLSGIFLGFVAISYIVLIFLDSGLFFRAFTFSLETIFKIIPVFILVFLLIFLNTIFLNGSEIKKHLGENGGFKGWLISIAGGIISSGPIYMWYPFLSDLQEKGMKKSFIAAFLYSRAIKIPLLPLMIFYFGVPFTIFFNFILLIFSFLNGFFVQLILEKN
jgi:uncharacterized membrane protein YraQ (UPF0718 family)